MSKKKNKGNKHENAVQLPKKNDSTTEVIQNDSIIKKELVWPLLAILLAVIVFYQTKNFDFVNWDDDRNFFENEHITTLNKENFWENTKNIFSSTVIGNYNPLTIWSFLIDQKMWGLDQPGSWHLVNLFWHCIAIFFVYMVARKLSLGTLGAFITAGLFAIHPMRVESVAWVTERKDVLFGAFYMIALYHYIRYTYEGHKRSLIWLFLFFTLSLLSKIQAVSLPLSMLAVDYLKTQKLDIKLIINKWPFWLMSLATGVLGVLVLGQEGSLDTNTNTYEFWQRIFVGTYSYVIYLIKLVVPYRMLPMYPYESNFPAIYYPTILIVPIMLYLLYWGHKKGHKYGVFGVLFFTFNIMFLLQVVGAGQGFIADRFTYIAYFGLFVVAAKAIERLVEKVPMVAYGSYGLLLVYAFVAYRQTGIWKNTDTLWTHVLQYHQNTSLPWGNRANYYRSQKMFDKALHDYNKAIALKNDPQTYNSRARLYFDNSNNRDTLLLALADYTKAIELKPGDAEFHTNRGATYARLGDAANALSDLNEAVKLNPNHAVAYLNRSIMLGATGRKQEALNDIIAYLNIRPYNSDLWHEKSRTEYELGKLQDALNSANRAIQLNANSAVYYFNRGLVKDQLGDIAGAKADVTTAYQNGFTNIDPQILSRLGIR